MGTQNEHYTDQDQTNKDVYDQLKRLYEDFGGKNFNSLKECRMYENKTSNFADPSKKPSHLCICNTRGKFDKNQLQTLDGQDASEVGRRSFIPNIVEPKKQVHGVFAVKPVIDELPKATCCCQSDPYNRRNRYIGKSERLSCCSSKSGTSRCCKCFQAEGHHKHLPYEKLNQLEEIRKKEIEERASKAVAQLPSWCLRYYPDHCTKPDVTNDISLVKRPAKCCYPNICKASCFDHLTKESWVDVVPPYTYFSQSRDTYQC